MRISHFLLFRGPIFSIRYPGPPGNALADRGALLTGSGLGKAAIQASRFLLLNHTDLLSLLDSYPYLLPLIFAPEVNRSRNHREDSYRLRQPVTPGSW